MANTETNVSEQLTDTATETVTIIETGASTNAVIETSLQSEIDALKKTVEELKVTTSETVTEEKPAETTMETAEEVVVETDTTQVTEKAKVDEEIIEKVNTGIDPALQERLDAQLKEIENLKKEMAKLRKANDFTSTGGSHQQNNKGGTSYSDGDINNFRWKI